MWTRKELKENAKLHFKANYWWTVLAALILAALLGNTVTLSHDFNKNDIKKLLNGTSVKNVILSDELDDAKEDIKDAAEDIKEAINDISEDEDFNTSIEINGQKVFGINAAGLNDENKDKVNNAIDSVVENIENAMDLENTKDIAEETMSVVFPIIILAIIISCIVVVFGICFSIFVKNPLEVGGRRFFMINHTEKANLGNYGFGFNSNYGNIVKTMFLKDLYIFLWSLLFIVPGIIKAYEYMMIPYLLSENPNMNTQTAFEKSKQLMLGNKWKTFVLDLSFIGWHLLSGLTMGLLGVFYVNPYVYQTNAELYFALNNEDDSFNTNESSDYASYVEVE